MIGRVGLEPEPRVDVGVRVVAQVNDRDAVHEDEASVVTARTLIRPI